MSIPMGPGLPVEPLLPFDPASEAASDKHLVVPTMKSVHIQGARCNHGSRQGETVQAACMLYKIGHARWDNGTWSEPSP